MPKISISLSESEFTHLKALVEASNAPSVSRLVAHLVCLMPVGKVPVMVARPPKSTDCLTEYDSVIPVPTEEVNNTTEYERFIPPPTKKQLKDYTEVQEDYNVAGVPPPTYEQWFADGCKTIKQGA